MLVLEAIETVNRELGTATALITHNAGIAEMADRVIRFGDGRIVEERAHATRARRAGARVVSVFALRPLQNEAAARSLAPARPGARRSRW